MQYFARSRLKQNTPSGQQTPIVEKASNMLARSLMLFALLLLSLPAAAQRVQLQAEEGPYFVDVPVRLQVVAEGFEETPQPEVEVDPPAQGRLELTGVSPSVSTSIQIINGKMTQSKRVEFGFQYRFVANEPGSYTLGPFRVRQDGRREQTGTLRLTIGEVPRSSDQTIRLILPDGPLIVGQRVPVRLEWWMPVELRGKVFNPQARIPLFERLDAFRFHDTPDPAAEVALTIETPSGPIELPATASVRTSNGEKHLVRSITREMIPLEAGEYRLEPASLVVDEAIRWRRTLFGDRVATHVRKQRVQGEAQTLVVADLPTAGRPASFTGTVGRGYTLEVAADRSVVQVGDPIRLSVTLRGDAAVETAVLPPLTADGGLSPQDFRIPGEKIAGIPEDGSKRFEISVRVLHDGVTGIPPLAFSWYDPVQQRFETTRSQPIALSVRPAQLVSAGDVVSAAGNEQNGMPDQRPAPAEPAQDTPAATQGRPAFSLSGADLAITTDIDTLMRQQGVLPTGIGMQAAAYGLGLLAMLAALLARRRAMADPAELARAKALSGHRARVAGASAITEVSDALRRMVAEIGTKPPAELDAFLAECDNDAFAPGGASHQIDERRRARAVELADSMLKEGAR